MILQIADLEKAFGLETKFGPGQGRVPGSYEVLLVLYNALRHEGIDAVYAIQCISKYPECVKGIFQLGVLGDDDIFEISAASHALPAMTPETCQTVDIMKAWVARQSVRRELRRRGLSTGE